MTGQHNRNFEFLLPLGELSFERRTELYQDILKMLIPAFAYAVRAEPKYFIRSKFDYEN